MTGYKCRVTDIKTRIRKINPSGLRNNLRWEAMHGLKSQKSWLWSWLIRNHSKMDLKR
jgi:hypothetical protein